MHGGAGAIGGASVEQRRVPAGLYGHTAAAFVHGPRRLHLWEGSSEPACGSLRNSSLRTCRSAGEESDTPIKVLWRCGYDN